jgi:hypothetical protein
MKAVGDILPEFLRKQPRKQVPVEEVLKESWAHVVGRPIAAHSRVFRLFGDILTVHVPDRVWKRQLFRLQPHLLARINQFLGRQAVTALDLRVDETLLPQAAAERGRPALQGGLFDSAAESPPPAPRKGPGQAASAEVDPDIANAARAIADPELRELFLRRVR